jgi:hypothetical protein
MEWRLQKILPISPIHLSSCTVEWMYTDILYWHTTGFKPMAKKKQESEDKNTSDQKETELIK